MATKKTSRVRARAAEPSTWAGLAGILLAAGQAYASTGSKTIGILTGLAAASGATAAVLPEKGKTDDTAK